VRVEEFRFIIPLVIPGRGPTAREPGIHNHRKGLWIPDAPPSKSAFADLDLQVPISGKPEIGGDPE
jgi:hypothetical protein